MESEKAQVLGMLNSSLKMKEQAQHQSACDSDLLKEIRSLREEVSWTDVHAVGVAFCDQPSSMTSYTMLLLRVSVPRSV